MPNYRSADAPALELLSTILSEGRASRLYRKLVYERRIALGAGGDYSYFSFDPNLFAFYATPLPGQTHEALEQALLAEVELLKAELVPDEELERAKNQIEASFVWRQDSVHSRAASLARFELLGSWRLQAEFVPKIRAVTADDLRRVARTYFPVDRKNSVDPPPSRRAGADRALRPMRRFSVRRPAATRRPSALAIALGRRSRCRCRRRRSPIARS